MDDDSKAMALVARTYLAREATEQELSAMVQEMQRDARWIVPHAYGRDGAMFDLEPESFLALMKKEAGA